MDQGRFFYKRVRLAAGLAAGVLVLLMVGACQQGPNLNISLPPTPQLFGSLPWGLVNVTYAKGFIEPNTESSVVIILRGGDVVQISSRSQQQERLNNVTDYWYQVELDGQQFWIFGNLLNQYGLEMQARTASEIVRDKLFKVD